MQTSSQHPNSQTSWRFHAAKLMPVIGTVMLRYSLVFFLLLFGAAKWTHDEAFGIQPMMFNSPLTSWLYRLFSIQGASIAIGVVELTLAVSIASRRFFPEVSGWGSTAAVLMFVTTLSFLVTTPHQDPGSQGFLMKDLVLLSAAIYTAGEAFATAQLRKNS